MTVRWPKSGWSHAGLALVVALVSSVCVFIRVNNTHFAIYAHEYPYDGQDGLSAMMDALHVGTITLLVVFILLFLIQRIFLR
jgi:hypothetical protein